MTTSFARSDSDATIDAPEEHFAAFSGTGKQKSSNSRVQSSKGLDPSPKPCESPTLDYQWEGEVIEEVFEEGVRKFKVAWEPTLEPGDNLSTEMRAVWEGKKAAEKAKGQQRMEASLSRLRGNGIKKKPGRPRKAERI